MSGKENLDRRTWRRQETRAEIVAAAWELNRANGLGNFSMRELGARVGMRAQSLYSYFSSKLEIYDAMFLEGNLAFIETVGDGDLDRDPQESLTDTMRAFLRFCTEDPIRYQLLFQRTIPDFEPSPESYATARQAYGLVVGPLRQLGLDDPDLDLVVAVFAGIAAQQIANDPAGDRWERLVPRAARMLLAELAPSGLGDRPT